MGDVGKMTADKTYIKLGSGRLVCLGGDIPAPPTSSVFIIYSSNMEQRGISWGRGHDTMTLGNRRKLRQLLSKYKH
jgi:hypothetical protein